MDKNNRLGKGLGALLGEKKVNFDPDVAGEKVKKISLKDIIPNKYQPRKVFNEDELNELTESIKQFGVLQPIIVRKNKNGYEIVAGERRFRASKIAGLKEIPVIVKEFTDKESLTLAIIENIQRSDLNAIDEAESYNKLINEFSYRHEDVGNAVGKSRAHITNLLRLLKLPNDVKDLLKNNQLTMGHARALIDNEWASEIAQDIIQQGLSVRQVEQIVKEGYNKEPLKNNGSRKSNEKKCDLSDYENDFYKKLGLKTKIDFNEVKKQGKIIIHYNNMNELKELLEKL